MLYGRITLLLAVGVSSAAAAPRSAEAPAGQPRATATDALPTLSEMRASFEDGDYPRTLQQVARALAVKGDAAGQYERHELLMLKGEAHLRLKNITAASAAFEEAARSATHAKAVAVGTVSAELVRRSRNLQYTPPATKKEKGAAAAAKAEPIDITDADGRARAVAAMLDDAKGRVAADVKAARAGTTLPPIVDALAMVRDLRLLELAAGDESGAAGEMAAGLAERARTLAERPVQTMAERVATIEKVASRAYTDYTPRRSRGGSPVTRVTSGLTGPSGPQATELRRIIADCRSIEESIARIAVVLRVRPDAATGPKGGDERGVGVLGGAILDELASVAKDADAVRNRAAEVLRLAREPAYGYDVYEDEERAFREQQRPGTNRIQRPIRGGQPYSNRPRRADPGRQGGNGGRAGANGGR